MECAERLCRALDDKETVFIFPEVHDAPVVETKHLTQCLFFLRKVLAKVDVQVHRRDLLCFLGHLDGSVALRELTQALTRVDEGFRRLALAQLLTKLLSVDFVGGILAENLSRPQARNVSHLLANLPANVANALKLDVPEFFNRSTFPKLLVDACCSRISALADDLRQNRDTCIGLVSAMVGKLGVHYPETFDRLVAFFLSKPDDFIFRRVVQRLVSDLPVDLQENAIILICYRTPCFRQMDWLLGDSVTKESNVKHILVRKLLLGRFFSNERVLKNVIGYLCSSPRRKEVAEEALTEVCFTWADKNLMKHQTIEHHRYLTCAVVTFVGFMKADFVLSEAAKSRCVKTVLHGVQNHLSSPDETIRNYGMLVGREFLSVVRSDVKAPDFDVVLADYDGVMAFSQTPSEKVEPIPPVEEKAARESVKEKAPVDSDDDSDTGDDDIVYQIDPQVKVPLYLRDCLRLMVPGNDGENIEQAKICLEHLPKLIVRFPEELADTAVDLCRLALFAEECPRVFPEIASLKREALVLLLIHAPVPASTFLIEQFYGVHVNHTQRLEILAALCLASERYAKEAPKALVEAAPKRPLKSSNILSQIDRITAEPRKTSEWTSDEFDAQSEVAGADAAAGQHEWKTQVEKRIATKTRKITSKTEISTEENRFGEVAGHFFFPLMRSFTCEVGFRIDDVDSFLLVQLLKTLGVIMHSAKHTPRAGQMGKALLQFAMAFQYHDHEQVRKACSFAVAAVLRSVPEELLSDENGLGSEAAEVGPWLETVATKVPTLDVKLPSSSEAAITIRPSALSTKRIQELT